MTAKSRPAVRARERLDVSSCTIRWNPGADGRVRMGEGATASQAMAPV